MMVTPDRRVNYLGDVEGDVEAADELEVLQMGRHRRGADDEQAVVARRVLLQQHQQRLHHLSRDVQKKRKRPLYTLVFPSHKLVTIGSVIVCQMVVVVGG
jgi:hypothetical protein